ncbi:uncharacterized protein DS421_19g675740 [Arachis hypogaea]|uniref:Uncharacterized protein n=1 Tax=Arachis hypogaea TaxID=3818 RepID=A0A6B9VG81_ARAHY|nr:uncharacterized protein DS421_19g675740 [Arachis hypogaea]
MNVFKFFVGMSYTSARREQESGYCKRHSDAQVRKYLRGIAKKRFR